VNATRIRKSAARKLYNAGAEVVMVSCKLYPFGGWSPGYTVRKSSIDAREDGWTFDALVDNYTSYNAGYEVGYYPAFYVDRAAAKQHGAVEMV
jgi:hypothetical protein